MNVDLKRLVKRLMLPPFGTDTSERELMAQAASALTALQAERDAATQAKECFQRATRDDWESLCAMRDSINEYIPMSSIDSGPLLSPEDGPIYADIAERVITEIRRLKCSKPQEPATGATTSGPRGSDANAQGVAERDAALARVAELEASLHAAWIMGRDDAAMAADCTGAIQDQRDGSYAGSVAVMGRDVGDIIRALTTPTNLEERLGGGVTTLSLFRLMTERAITAEARVAELEAALEEPALYDTVATMISDLSHTGELSMVYRCEIADAMTTMQTRLAAALTRAWERGRDDVKAIADNFAACESISIAASTLTPPADLCGTPAEPAQVTVQEAAKVWQWWASANEEWFTVGPCATKEQAIDEAINDGIGEWLDESQDPPAWMQSFEVVEARQDPLKLSDWIGADWLLERADESLADSDRVSCENDDGSWFVANPDQETDLINRVKAACDDWQSAHGLVFHSTTFSHQRNSETITRAIAGGRNE